MSGNPGLGKVSALVNGLGWETEYVWAQQCVMGIRACSDEAGQQCLLVGLRKVLASMLVRCPSFWDYQV